jgi:hypothetical protein
MIRNLGGQSIGAELVDVTTGAAFVGAVTVYVTIDAGAQAIGSVSGGACTAEGNGLYTYRPSQAETDGAVLAFTFTGTGAIPVTTQVATRAAATSPAPFVRNQAGQSIGAQLVNATTGANFTGVVTVYVTIDAGVQAIGTVGGGLGTAEGNGFYTYRPSRAETNGALIAFTFTGAGAIPVTIQTATLTAISPVSDTSLNARGIITDALIDLGVLEPGDALSAQDAALGLRHLNRFIGSLKTQRLSFPFLDREVFTVIADQGTYTIGPGGDFDTIRPQNIVGAGWLAPTTGATTGQLEVPVRVLTDREWESISLKDLTNAQWTAVHYSPTYAGGLGTIRLWPIPNTALNELVLYRGDVVQGFANLTTFYDFPPGYAELLQFNLEKRLCRVYGKAREWGALDDELARDAIRLVKRQNFTLNETALDQTLGHPRGGYAIEIGGYD